MSSNNNFVHVPTMQGDGNGIRGFEVELIQNGMQYLIDKEDSHIFIMGTKPDTRHIMNDCGVTEDGYITVDITSQMSAVKGRGDYQIVLMSQKTNSQLKSFPFHIITTSAAFDADYVTSSDEFQALTRNITTTKVVISEGKEAISDMRELESSVKVAEDSRRSAEEIRINAENTRLLNEKARQDSEIVRRNNEDVREKNEKERQDEEALRKTNEDKRLADENIRIKNEAARCNAEIVRENDEDIRKSNERSRVDAENTRRNAETDRINAENNRSLNETTRQTNESIRQKNEETRQKNETSRQTAITTAISDMTAATDRANKAADGCEAIISGTGYIAHSEKGAANGIATLGSDRKLNVSQLPLAEDNSFGAVKTGNNITINNGIISVTRKNIISALGYTPTTELVSSSEPSINVQNIGDFWLQEY